MVDYLIIAPSKFNNDLKDLHDLRGEKYRVRMADPEQIYAAAPAGATREEALQRFVREMHRRTGGELKYLLLVGDDTPADLPEEIPVGKYDANILSDAYYGDITGDDLPEIAVGRLPATSAEGVRDFVAKVLEYENGSQSRAMRNRLSFYAGRGNFGPVQDLLLEAFVYALLQRRVPRSYQLDLHYDAEESVFNTGRTFAEMLNAGSFALTYMGHGASNLLATDPPFGAGDLGAVATENNLPLLNLMACSAGCFANNDCLGEQLALLRRGPVTVIGSNETISPPVLQFFGDRMAEYLGKNGDTTIGDVFLHAQQHLTDENDFLLRILKELPAPLAERTGLTRDVEKGILRQGLQMSLMGDPAMTWRLPPETGEKNGADARLKGPPTGRMRERISLPQGEGRGKGGLSTKTLRYEDLETVLSLADYLLYRVPDLVGREAAALLPKPGTVTLDHGIVRVPFAEPVAVPSRELPPYLKQLLFPAGLGELRFEKRFSFSASFQSGVVTLDDITGISLLPDNNERRSLAGLKIDLNAETPRFEARFGLPPVSREETAAENARLEKLFEGQPVKPQLEWDTASLTADYVLLRKLPGNGRFVRERKLSPVDTNHLPAVLEGRGLLLTLPYGTRVGYSPDEVVLALQEVPAGEKTQSYLLIPFADGGNRVPPHDPDEALRSEIREVFALKDRPIPDTAGGRPFGWPLYSFYVHKEPPTIQRVSFGTAAWMKGPLFARKPSAPSGAETRPEAETSLEDESGFSWSGLNRTGAEVCLVLDGSGSMGRPIERAWTALYNRVEDIPSRVRPFIKGALVALREGEELPLVDELTHMTEAGVQKFDRAIREFAFQGEEGNLQSGIEACRKIVTPNPDGSVYRGIFVLSDTEGLAEQSLETGFGIEAMETDRALELLKVGEILKPAETETFQKHLNEILTRSLVPKKRAAAVAATMAPYFPQLRTDEKEIWEMATGYAAQQISAPERIAFFEEQLGYGAIAERSERVTEMIVAAMALLPPEEFEILWPRLAYLQEQAVDEPLREAIAKTKGTIATAHKGQRYPTELEKRLAEDYYQQTLRDPEAVPLDALESLLLAGSPAVNALLHIAQYGTRERQLRALHILTDKSEIVRATMHPSEAYGNLIDLKDFNPHLRKAIRNFLIRLGVISGYGVEEEP